MRLTVFSRNNCHVARCSTLWEMIDGSIWIEHSVVNPRPTSAHPCNTGTMACNLRKNSRHFFTHSLPFFVTNYLTSGLTKRIGTRAVHESLQDWQPLFEFVEYEKASGTTPLTCNVQWRHKKTEHRNSLTTKPEPANDCHGINVGGASLMVVPIYLKVQSLQSSANAWFWT